MKQLIENFSNQLAEAVKIGKKSNYVLPKINFSNVVVSGLGGSGIGATIVQEYVFDKLKIPFITNKDYFIPSFVNAQTFFIACSYSGNTEETLMAVAEAKKRKATIVCITSGGALQQFAEKNKYPCIIIPSGMPPRSCLGYSLVQILYVLAKAKLITSAFEKEIISSIALLNKEGKKIKTLAEKTTQKITGNQLAIYTTASHDGLAVRFRQQINENSKMLAWSNVIPEMTHNEIVGWKTNHDELTVVYCYAKTDFERNLRRMKVLKEVTKKYKSNQVDIEIKGNSFFEQVFYFVHLTDWVSVFLADRFKHDIVEVKVIDYLKATMNKK